MKHKKFVVLGAQASGKGTQAEILSKKFKIPIIGMGALLRAESRRKTPRGRLIHSIIRTGKFVPFQITNKLIKNQISRPAARRGFVIDGYPRHIVQAKFLSQIAPGIRVILIKISDTEAKKRIAGRRVCAKCGDIYNLIADVPKKRGVCNSCGGRLVLREDDQPKIVKARLKLFHQETEPVLKYFARRGELIEAGGAKTIAEVAREINKKIK